VDSTDSPTESWEIGRHRVRVEHSDLVHVVYVGPVKAAEAKRLKELIFALGEHLGPYHLIIGAAEFGALETGALTILTRIEQPYPLRHVIVYGASFASRVAISTVQRAGALISPKFFDWRMDFLPDEASALARVEALRAAPPSSRPRK
jgi:hypothetical protein